MQFTRRRCTASGPTGRCSKRPKIHRLAYHAFANGHVSYAGKPTVQRKKSDRPVAGYQPTGFSTSTENEGNYNPAEPPTDICQISSQLRKCPQFADRHSRARPAVFAAQLDFPPWTSHIPPIVRESGTTFLRRAYLVNALHPKMRMLFFIKYCAPDPERCTIERE